MQVYFKMSARRKRRETQQLLEYWDFVTAQDSSSSLSERESVEDESTHDEVTKTDVIIYLFHFSNMNCN